MLKVFPVRVWFVERTKKGREKKSGSTEINVFPEQFQL